MVVLRCFHYDKNNGHLRIEAVGALHRKVTITDNLRKSECRNAHHFHNTAFECVFFLLEKEKLVIFPATIRREYISQQIASSMTPHFHVCDVDSFS